MTILSELGSLFNFGKRRSVFHHIEDVVSRIITGLMTVQDKKDVLSVVAQELQLDLNVDHISFFVREGDDFLCHDYLPMQLCMNPIKVGSDHPFIKTFFDRLSVVPYGRLDPVSRISLDGVPLSPYSLCLPFHSMEQLQAIFILGPQNGQPYSTKDMVLFESLLNQVVLVFDRITQVEQLRRLYKQVGRYNEKMMQLNTDLQEALTKKNNQGMSVGLGSDVLDGLTQIQESLPSVQSILPSAMISKNDFQSWLPDGLHETCWQFLCDSGYVVEDGTVVFSEEVDFTLPKKLRSYESDIRQLLSYYRDMGRLSSFVHLVDEQVSDIMAHSESPGVLKSTSVKLPS